MSFCERRNWIDKNSICVYESWIDDSYHGYWY